MFIEVRESGRGQAEREDKGNMMKRSRRKRRRRGDWSCRERSGPVFIRAVRKKRLGIMD